MLEVDFEASQVSVYVWAQLEPGETTGSMATNVLFFFHIKLKMNEENHLLSKISCVLALETEGHKGEVIHNDSQCETRFQR